jgi:hypothetical protein
MFCGYVESNATEHIEIDKANLFATEIKKSKESTRTEYGTHDFLA